MGGCTITKTRKLGERVRQERLTSVGIDIGTSTLQCVFSLMTLENLSPPFAVPKVALTDKRVLYRAPLRLTPLSSPDTIDFAAVARLIEADYARAGIRPAEIGCGAVIITGETALKKNAREVTQALAGLAGDFVVATAGPELEAVLAGRGAGAAALSKARGKTVLNLDIGGGTTNMCLFDRGEPTETGCLHVGGRLLRFTEAGAVRSFTPALSLVARDVGVALAPGAWLSSEAVSRVARRMAEVLEEAVNLRPRTPLYHALLLGHGLPEHIAPDLVTFSGGVADCVYQADFEDTLFFDIGRALGQSLSASRFFTEGRVVRPQETLHATVIGAGAYSVTVTGSTISHSGVALPMKGLPVARVRLETPQDIFGLGERILGQRSMFEPPFAIGFEGLKSPTYEQIEAIAEEIARGMGDTAPRVVIMAQDMAKALGQALMRRWGTDASMLCLDGISLTHGDMVDLGAPLADGRVLPVVVKTLAFAT
jgi:ethanolamine utilization protein EutA